MEQKFKVAQQTFDDVPEDKQEFLKIFSFICMLSFDVYVKKMLIEKMIDGLDGTEAAKEKKERKKAKNVDDASQTE